MPIEARVIRLIPVVVWILTVLVDKYAWLTPRLAIPLPIHPNAPRPQTSLIPSLVRAFTSLCVPRRLASCAADYVNLCMMEASSVGVKAEVVASAVAGTLVGACLFPGLWPWIWLSFKDLPCAPRHDIRAEMNVHGDEGLGAVNHNVDLDDAYPPEVVYLSTADGYGMAMMGFRCATSGSVLLLVRVLGVTMMDTIVLCVSRLRRLTPVTRLQSSEFTSHVGYVASLSSSWALHGSRVLYFATGYGLGKLWARRESVAIFLSQVPLLGSIFEASLPLPVPAALLEADLEFSGECVVLRFPVGKAGDKTGTVVVPATVICPIFRRLMRNPVQTVDGYIYDREGILAWFSMHQTSPMTNVKLENCDVQPHHESRLSIKKAICDYHQATSTG